MGKKESLSNIIKEGYSSDATEKISKMLTINTIVLIYNSTMDKILFRISKNGISAGLYDLINSRVSRYDNNLKAVYKMVEEELSIGKDDIELVHFIDQKLYYPDSEDFQVYLGKLNKDVRINNTDDVVFELLDKDRYSFTESYFANNGDLYLPYLIRLGNKYIDSLRHNPLL